MPRLGTCQFRPLTRQRIPPRQLQSRSYHPEPRSVQSSSHGSHRALYRWTAQAFGLPFLVAYVCDKIASSSDGGESSWKLDIPHIEAGLLVEPLKMKTQAWGHM